ncbi:MAG: hypothetical protein JST04_17815 [Bdellovibrionales bacterium]|nr:hypothetical protein [Bdellovibrionales bacterium]
MKTISLVSFLVVGTAFGGMTIENAHWRTNSVEVCFASKKQAKASRFGEDSKTFPTQPAKTRLADPTADERSLLETILRAEYRMDTTGFEFTGFRDCAAATGAKIYVYLGSGGPLGAANIGENMRIEKYWQYHDREGHQILSPVYVKDAAGKPSYVYLQNLKSLSGVSPVMTPAELLQMHALHEFGHAAGLLHEDERTEANGGANCAYANGQSMVRTSAPVLLTKYDPASIMSYCFLDTLTTKTGLHYQVATAGTDPAKLPRAGLPLVRWPGLFFEDGLRSISHHVSADRHEFEIRLGLSEKDRASIRCLYTPGSACHGE